MSRHRCHSLTRHNELQEHVPRGHYQLAWLPSHQQETWDGNKHSKVTLCQFLIHKNRTYQDIPIAAIGQMKSQLHTSTRRFSGYTNTVSIAVIELSPDHAGYQRHIAWWWVYTNTVGAVKHQMSMTESLEYKVIDWEPCINWASIRVFTVMGLAMDHTHHMRFI